MALKGVKDKLLSDDRNKVVETKENKAVFRRFSPQLGEVIEAESREEWEKKVLKKLEKKVG